MLGLTPEISLPLFSFNTIVDMDMALFKLVMLEYRNDEVFDMDKISSMSYIEVLHNIYYRKEENLLRLFVRDKKYINFIDECYHEFTTVHRDKIYKYAVTTEILNLIDIYSNASDITPSIFYYTESERKLLDNIPELKNVEKLSLRETKSNVYSSIYFKTIDELEPFKELTGKTFYFSTIGTNFKEDNDDEIKIEDNEIKRLFFNQNKISIFDLYRSDIIGR